MIQARARPMPMSPATCFRIDARVRSGRVVGCSSPSTRAMPRPMTRKWMTWLERKRMGLG